MEGSKERIDFIIEYISAYEAKIKIANKNSLFDEAQLFELFAQEICNLWYGKKFTNLNSIKKNYPCVDLLSEDGEIYVQVSTQEDIPGKIKKTLLSLEEEKYPELSNISAPVFFVLSNDTEQKVKDLVGKNQIGRFPFSVKDNFVSTSMIVQRACNDIEFQKSLYDFLKYEIDGISSISSKLLNIFDISKNVGLSNINTMINGEYEIDRSSLLKSIQDDDAQFKVVCGDAGSGKSAICKKVLMEEEMVIFARAEKIASCDSINNIWDLDVVEALKYLGEKKAVIYLDALEYISRNANFIGIDFFNCNLRGTSFKNTSFKNVVFYNCNLRDADFKDAIFENVVFICTNFKEVKNLDFDNPEINILKTYNRIDLNSAVESRLLALAQNDLIFDARVLHVNKNKLNHWVLSLLNAKYGDKAILFLSKLLPKKEKWNNMYTIYSYMQLIENLMKA